MDAWFKIWSGIAHNRTLLTAVAAWFVAQLLKTIIYCIVNKKFDINRLVGDGGMPSGHSATVTALAIRSAMDFGTASSGFAIAAILAIVVMHDAMGVRRESGKHAKALNEIIAIMSTQTDSISQDKALKEFLGHTPLQVVAGALLGVIVAAISTLF